MADVLIRGIRMPCNAEGCEVIIRIQPNGEVLDAHKIHIGATAIQLQEGHGRLIDAYRLGVVLSKNFGGTAGANVMQQLIDAAPTIIEAEGGNDNDSEL